MREIEIKLQLNDLPATIATLKNAGVTLSAPKEQHDVVYCLPGDRDKENDPSINWLRIRTENGKTVTFTLKRSVAGSLDSIEHETQIANATEMTSMLEYMGYIVYNDLTKIRRTGHIDSIEICIDELPGLGAFIELEKMCDEHVDGSEIEQELLGVLDGLGIDYAERITKGYDELMNEFIAKKAHDDTRTS
jgi:adenylate cyclase class 2